MVASLIDFSPCEASIFASIDWVFLAFLRFSTEDMLVLLEDTVEEEVLLDKEEDLKFKSSFHFYDASCQNLVFRPLIVSFRCSRSSSFRSPLFLGCILYAAGASSSSLSSPRKVP
jgi:hypothetical protein